MQDQRTEFRTYMTKPNVPSVTYREEVVMGATLPETVTYRAVPAQYGTTNTAILSSTTRRCSSSQMERTPF